MAARTHAERGATCPPPLDARDCCKAKSSMAASHSSSSSASLLLSLRGWPTTTESGEAANERCRAKSTGGLNSVSMRCGNTSREGRRSGPTEDNPQHSGRGLRSTTTHGMCKKAWHHMRPCRSCLPNPPLPTSGTRYDPSASPPRLESPIGPSATRAIVFA